MAGYSFVVLSAMFNLIGGYDIDNCIVDESDLCVEILWKLALMVNKLKNALIIDLRYIGLYQIVIFMAHNKERLVHVCNVNASCSRKN